MVWIWGSQTDREFSFIRTSLWRCVCVYVFVHVHTRVCEACCFLGDVWEGVEESNDGVTWRVSARHSLLYHELFFFLFWGCIFY